MPFNPPPPADHASPSPLRVLIVDDEEPARWRLRQLVDECSDPKAAVVGEAAHAAEALRWLSHGRCDLLLLDIAMPGVDGLALAERLRQGADAPAIVFVTAHAEHALQAFELAALDYLTKPVRRDRLQAALARAAAWVALRRGAVAAGAAPPVASPGAPSTVAPPTEPPVLVVSDRGRIVRVPVDEVLYLKAELKYVTLRTAQHTHLLDDSLTELEQRLGDRFLRIHRNALVARRAVRALDRRHTDAADDAGEGWAVQVAEVGEWLAVSRRQLAAVKDALQAASR